MEIKTYDYNDVKIQMRQLDVGWAYSVPSVFKGWRRANNEDQALKHAREDTDSAGKEHQWRHEDGNSGGPEHIFHLKEYIKELEAELKKK